MFAFSSFLLSRNITFFMIRNFKFKETAGFFSMNKHVFNHYEIIQNIEKKLKFKKLPKICISKVYKLSSNLMFNMHFSLNTKTLDFHVLLNF